MALLKYLRGKAANIDTTTTPFHDGYVYFTTDEGKMYVDCNTGTDAAPNNQRIPVNAENANKLGNIAAAEYATLTALAAKADKKIPSAAGNLATLDANGNLADGGKAVAALEPFVITATRGALTDGVYEITHDKTLAEIYAAYQANKRVIVSLTDGGTQTIYELSTMLSSSSYIFSWFGPKPGSMAVNAWLKINQDYGGWMAYQYPILDSGGIMKGDLTLAADPTAALMAATKKYVDTGDAAKLGTSGDGSNVTAAFTQATSRANIVTGEKLSVILGKIMKWFADLGTAAFVGTSATPTSGGTTVFTTGGAYTQLAAKQETTNSLTAETELADADYVPFYDASASAHRKTLWSNIKAVLKTYFDTLYAAAGHVSDSAAHSSLFSSKASKKVPAATGNLAGLDANGNLTDSGKKPADFAAAEHSHSGYATTDALTAHTGNVSNPHAVTGGQAKISDASIAALLGLSGDPTVNDALASAGARMRIDIIKESKNWIAPSGIIGKVKMILVGGGGAGGSNYDSGSGYHGGSGGGGGNVTITEQAVVAGQSYAAVIGAGGARSAVNSSTISAKGGDGGTTSFNGLSAAGGGGGLADGTGGSGGSGGGAFYWSEQKNGGSGSFGGGGGGYVGGNGGPHGGGGGGHTGGSGGTYGGRGGQQNVPAGNGTPLSIDGTSAILALLYPSLFTALGGKLLDTGSLTYPNALANGGGGHGGEGGGYSSASSNQGDPYSGAGGGGFMARGGDSFSTGYANIFASGGGGGLFGGNGKPGEPAVTSVSPAHGRRGGGGGGFGPENLGSGGSGYEAGTSGCVVLIYYLGGRGYDL